jgi:hypothetical protein
MCLEHPTPTAAHEKGFFSNLAQLKKELQRSWDAWKNQKEAPVECKTAARLSSSWRAQGSGLRFAQHQHYVLRTAKGFRKERACVKKGANVAAREIFSLVSFGSSLTTVDATTSWRELSNV